MPKNGSGNGRGATQEAPPKEKGSPPVWSRKMWTGSANVEVAVFSKVVNEGGQGEFTAMNTTCRRTWKSEGGEYQSSSSFRQEDLPVLIQLLTQAHAEICRKLNDRE